MFCVIEFLDQGECTINSLRQSDNKESNNRTSLHTILKIDLQLLFSGRCGFISNWLPVFMANASLVVRSGAR